jgi:tetratricopeptide (TPR) repeat protein
VNALWASSRGYGFIVYGDVPEQPVTYDARYGKVALLKNLLAARAQAGLAWLLWIDADAVVVRHSWDVQKLGAAHPRASMITCAEANLETNTRINSGTLLIRASSPWSAPFFRGWWEHTDAALGAPDQWTFDSLWAADALGIASGGHVAVLPATAFNSEPPFYETFRGAHAQPVIHLMGDAAPVRARIFRRMAAALCAKRRLNASSTDADALTAAEDWPPAPGWLLSEMTAGYAAAAEDALLTPEARVHALDRLGMIYNAQGRSEERVTLLRKALEIKEGVYGRDSPALAHEVQVLANMLSELSRHDEALPLMRRALKLAAAARDPKGAPQTHLVAAAHGDLGCASHAHAERTCLPASIDVQQHHLRLRAISLLLPLSNASAVWANGRLHGGAVAPAQVPCAGGVAVGRGEPAQCGHGVQHRRHNAAVGRRARLHQAL